MKGWLGGGTIGANVQAGVFVFGVEGEILGGDIKGSQTANVPTAGLIQTLTVDSKIDWLALATARAGFAVGDRLLVYGKGGLAIANENHGFNFTQVQANPAGTAALSETAKAVHTGVVIGAGAEYAFSANWSVKLEYDYVKMFQQQATGSGTLATNVAGQVATIYETTLLSRFTQDLQLVKVGVNYHFSPMPVVAAKY